MEIINLRINMALTLGFFLLIGVSTIQCKSLFLSRIDDVDGKLLVKRDTNSNTNASTDQEDVKNSTSKPDIYSFTVTSNITYRYATTTVSNRVANKANVPKEISFTVTLPESAFISKFLMEIKGKVYEAYVKKKEEAKQDYDAAVQRGDTAGYVELSARHSNLFTVSVNVEPHSKVTFNLTYDQLLTRTLGEYEHVINVNPGQVVKLFKIDVNIEESAPLTHVEVDDFKTSNEINANDSKSINTILERPTNNVAKISWTPDKDQQKAIGKEGVKGQLVVRYDVDRTVNSNQILVDEGYFVHFYAPTDLKPLNKHVIFALDVSGSMSGSKIKQLKEALDLILSDISEHDFFTLIIFSDDIEVWTLNGTVGKVSSDYSSSWYSSEVQTTTLRPIIEPSSRFVIPATADNVAKAKQYAAGLQDTGSTNIIAALRKSLEIADWFQKTTNNTNVEPLIIFLTDGQPNVEMSDTDDIVTAVKKQNAQKHPLFSLAFGDGADLEFLRKLSLSNGGFARNIYVASDASLQLKNFYKEVASPVLSNVTFTYVPGQIDEASLTKKEFGDLFNGSELIVAGKLNNAADKQLFTGNLTGVSFDGFFCSTPSLTPRVNKLGHLEKVWAYMNIKNLLDKKLIANEAEQKEYEKQATELALKYKFVTPLTSLVIVKPNDTSSEGNQLKPSDLNNNGFAYSSGLRGGNLKLGFASPGFANLHAYDTSMAAGFGAPMLLSAPMRHSVAMKVSPTAQRISLPTSYLSGAGKLSGGGLSGFSGNVMSVDDSSEYLTTTAPPPSFNISDITWLVNETDVKFPNSNNSYSIFSGNSPNNEFQSCKLPNTTNSYSHCRHLAHCVLPEIVNSFTAFVPYGENCVIDARFVGICCPPSFVKNTADTTSSDTVTTETLSTSTLSPFENNTQYVTSTEITNNSTLSPSSPLVV